MRPFFLTIIFLGLMLQSQAQKRRIWIDTDIMIGKFRRDVDDGLALILMLQDTSLNIEGISFVHGVAYAEKVTGKMLNWYTPDRNIPTFKGSDDSTGLGVETDAVKAMISALEKGPLSIMALGPATNIATVLQLRPDLHRNISNVVYCAGRKPGMLFNPGSGKVKFSDYNFDLDPRSSEILLQTEIPLLLAGYDCSDSLFLSRKDFIHLKRSSNKGDRWLFRQLKDWENLWRMFLGSKKGFIPFDCATVGALLYMSEFELSESGAAINIAVNDSRHTVKTPSKSYLLVNQPGTRLVAYCEGSKPAFKERLLRLLGHPDYQ
jgi:pyrimidine-specific ribonucleoside hydrolase